MAETNRIRTGQIAEEAWTSWTPTWTNLTVGNGIVNAKYQRIGKTVICKLEITFGTTTSTSGLISFTLPVTGTSLLANSSLGYCYMLVGGTPFSGFFGNKSTADAYIFCFLANQSYLQGTATSATIPATWAVNSTISGTFTYEAA